MSISPLEYLRHMLYEAEYLIITKKGLDRRRFLLDPTLTRAFARSIEIIGEASRKIPSEIKSRYPDVEWKSMAGMRDRLIHAYFGVDYDLVWDVVENKIPALRQEILTILEEETRRPA